MRHTLLVGLAFALGCSSAGNPSTPTSGRAPTSGAATTTPKAKDLILGKWEVVESKDLTYEFKANGLMVKSMDVGGGFPLVASAKYTFIADDMIQVEMQPLPEPLGDKNAKSKPEKIRVSVSKDELTLTLEGDKPQVLKMKRKM